MTTTTTTFIEPTLVTLTEQSLYQVPALAKALGKYFYLYNSGSVPVAITVNLPKSGEISGASNEFFYGLIPAKRGRRLGEFNDRQLEPGTTIRVVASVDSVVNVSANGIVIV